MARKGRSFYQQGMTTEDQREFLEASREASVDEEIALVRTRIRALGAEEPQPSSSLRQQALLLKALDLLVRLIRLKSQLQPNQEDLLAELNESILQKLERGE